MQIYRYPLLKSWPEITQRPSADNSDKVETVREVMSKIREEGDAAIRGYTNLFDHVDIADFAVTADEIKAAVRKIDPELKNAITIAARNIDTFHVAQKVPHRVIETMPGVKCWQKSVPIDRVGLYIPGGSAPLFSTVLMLGIPAMIAGCRNVILCTPPDHNGEIHPAILFAASICHITGIYKIGGMQAIGAMAYGTESIQKVDKIFGPGNSWVTAAKQFVAMADCAIDMPAGPSEVAVMADETANPAFVAADLLSQAEHGPDSQVVLVTTNEKLIHNVIKVMGQQLKELPRATTAAKALDNSRAILVNDVDEMISLINFYAPEHLIIATKDAAALAERITNAGSVFIGNYSPESAGDYASGTNHTLPTNGWAKSFSGIGLDSFCKKITFQEITHEGIMLLGPVIEQMAEAEQLFAHKNAATLRMQ
ncbi:MAG TPA: histidinol dehydrogenase [Prolixibacteraceae bacterium]|nr:histidinol dehydrogenase [Prolixibacteraceae bacterium]